MDYYKRQLEEENERELKAIDRRRLERKRKAQKRKKMIDAIVNFILLSAFAAGIGFMYVLIMAGYTGLIEIL